MENFRKLGISDEIIRKIEEAGFKEPSIIQERAIPAVLQGKDVIAQSATGSGKTLVFGVPILQNLEHGKGIQALVMTPTRELAEQVSKSLRSFSKYKNFFITAVYGGVSLLPQMDHLKKADIVVGTPGRILDHLGRNTLDLSKVRILVLDEADRMLEMGFIEDVHEIIKHCPRQRQTLLFSATIPEEIRNLTRKYMHQPFSIKGEEMVDPAKLEQIYYDVKDNMKFSLLVHLIKQEKEGLVMVFTNSRMTADFIANNLQQNGIEALAIHGGLPQAKRTKVLSMFHSGRVYVLVCTDVAARGLDIPGVTKVFNYDAPKDSKQYVHRIGRTARAGKEGRAISLVSDRDYDNFGRLLHENSLEIPKEETPHIERARVGWTHRPRSQGPRAGSPRHRFGQRQGQGMRRGFRPGQRGQGMGSRNRR